jgi:hypothetical protein
MASAEPEAGPAIAPDDPRLQKAGYALLLSPPPAPTTAPPTDNGHHPANGDAAAANGAAAPAAPPTTAAEPRLEYYVRKPRIVLGRSGTSVSSEVDVLLGPSPNLSRRHAEIFCDRVRRRWYIRPLGKNGVLVNGELHSPAPDGRPAAGLAFAAPLRSRDLLQIGDRTFYFLLPRPPKKKQQKKKEQGAGAAGAGTTSDGGGGGGTSGGGGVTSEDGGGDGDDEPVVLLGTSEAGADEQEAADQEEDDDDGGGGRGKSDG